MTRPGDSGNAGDPEVVLSQTLRAMAGGPRPSAPRSQPAPPRRGLSLLQLCLVFVLVGLTVGVVAGVLTLLI